MSHLPPKPDFGSGSPGKYPPDYRHYARPPPADRYRPERDVYPPRSPPPRSRYATDSYVAARHADGYRAPRPPVDSYVASSYERREDDRYVEYWERERDWRARDAPSHDARRVAWEREHDRLRRWEARGGYERDRREYSPPRYHDYREEGWRHARERPREEFTERVWIPRKSKSPPRRMGRLRRSASPASARGRSPRSRSPRARPRSPQTRGHSRPPSPGPSAWHGQSRATSPAPEVKLGNHSIPASPRRSEHDIKSGVVTPRNASPIRGGRSRKNSRSRSAERGRSRSAGRRSPSIKQEAHLSHSLSPPSHTNSPMHTVSRRVSPIPQTPRRKSPVFSPASPERKSNIPSPYPVKPETIERPTSTPWPSRTEEKGKMRQKMELLNTDDDVKMQDLPSPFTEAGSSPMKPEHREVSASPAKTRDTRDVVPSPTKPRREDDGPPPRRRRSRSPPAGPRNYVKTPPTPSSPHPIHGLPPKPSWSRRGPAHPGTMPRPGQGGYATEPQSAPPSAPPSKPRRSFKAKLEEETRNVHAEGVRLAAEYAAHSKAVKRALHELEMASMDLELAERRRAVADAQLEKARIGQLGIEYHPRPQEQNTASA